MPEKPIAVQLAELQDERVRVGAILANLRRDRDRFAAELAALRSRIAIDLRNVNLIDGIAAILDNAMPADPTTRDLADLILGEVADRIGGLNPTIGDRDTAPVPGSSRRAPEPTDLLRMAADGRREYAESIRRDPAFENVVELLDLQADTIAAAVRVIEGDLGPLYNWLPSWRWTDEMEAALFGKTSGTEPAGESQASEPAAPAERLAATEPTAPVKIRGIRVYRPDERRCADPDRPVRIEVAGVAYVDLTDADAHQVAALLVGVADWPLPAAPKLAQGGIVRPSDKPISVADLQALRRHVERPIDLDDRTPRG